MPGQVRRAGYGYGYGYRGYKYRKYQYSYTGSRRSAKKGIFRRGKKAA